MWCDWVGRRCLLGWSVSGLAWWVEDRKGVIWSGDWLVVGRWRQKSTLKLRTLAVGQLQCGGWSRWSKGELLFKITWRVPCGNRFPTLGWDLLQNFPLRLTEMALTVTWQTLGETWNKYHRLCKPQRQVSDFYSQFIFHWRDSYF